MRTKLGAIRAQALLGAALSLSTGAGATLVLWIGARETMAGHLSIGDLLLVIAYVTQLYGPLQQIGNHLSGQQQALASAERAFALLDRAPSVPDAGKALMERAAGEVRFEESFRRSPRRSRRGMSPTPEPSSRDSMPTRT